MRFYWLWNKQQNKNFDIYWDAGPNNLYDYYTKHYTAQHYKYIRKKMACHHNMWTACFQARCKGVLGQDNISSVGWLNHDKIPMTWKYRQILSYQHHNGVTMMCWGQIPYKIKYPPLPWIYNKYLLVQSSVKCTAFSDQKYFSIDYITNLFHMNEVFLLLYQVMDRLGFFNLEFNYTSRLNKANFLSFSGGKGDTKSFWKNGES